jgi:DNA-nicking Smr family endonuclease
VKKKENITNKDQEIWEEYVKNPKDLFDKDLKGKKFLQKPKRYHFDLHGFTLLEANKKVKELILSCQEKGFSEILLITGKGLHSNTDQNTYVSKNLSKLKFAVPEYINTQKDLLDKIFIIEQAKVSDGGEGAIIIKLKKL